jgi:lysyl-tRNA synthetase class 2
MQISVSDAASGASNHAAFRDWDIGDIVGVTGILYRSAAGALTLRAHDIRLLVKSLRPVPDQHELRRVTLIRSRLLTGIRDFMRHTHYIEVETPLLQPAPDGAAPAFETYHNALQLKLYLRSAAALYLQSLVIGGVEKVYEINRSFRNEREAQRPAEVTTMEIYCAYTNHHYMMTLLERVIAHATLRALGTTRVSLAGREVDFGAPFARAEFTQVLVDGVAPTFVVDYPAAAAPGARCKDQDPGLAEYFRLFAGGEVLAEGLSLLNDPGIPVGHDADFVRALEYGMPPSCGARLEIDRLVTLLAGGSEVRPC